MSNQTTHEQAAKEWRSKFLAAAEAGNGDQALQVLDTATTEGQRLARLLDESDQQLEQLRSAATATGGRQLTKEVREDYQRRVSQGLHPDAAMEAALRQQGHNKVLKDETSDLAKQLARPEPTKKK